MKLDHPDPYEDLFQNSYGRLTKTLKAKLEAIQNCQ